MRNLSQSLQSHFQSEVTTVASCFKITRKDGVVLCFTDHDKFLIIDDLYYDSINSFTATNVQTSSDMAVDNLDISSFTGEEESRGLVSKITAGDLLSGKYDFADVEIFLVNYMDLNAGKLVQKRGIIGEVTLKKNMFYAEVRGISQFLSQTLCEKYVPKLAELI